MKKIELFEQTFYKNTQSSFYRAQEHLNRRISDNYLKKSTVISEAEELISNIEREFKKGIAALTEKLEEENAAIVLDYKTKKKTYTNGTEEILHRQDFEMRLKFMSLEDIEELVGLAGRQDQAKLTEFELNMIKTVLETRKDIESSTKNKLVSRLNALQITHNIGKEWKEDNNYRKNEELLTQIMQTGRYIWLEDTEREYAPKDIRGTLMRIALSYKE